MAPHSTLLHSSPRIERWLEIIPVSWRAEAPCYRLGRICALAQNWHAHHISLVRMYCTTYCRTVHDLPCFTFPIPPPHPTCRTTPLQSWTLASCPVLSCPVPALLSSLFETLCRFAPSLPSKIGPRLDEGEDEAGRCKAEHCVGWTWMAWLHSGSLGWTNQDAGSNHPGSSVNSPCPCYLVNIHIKSRSAAPANLTDQTKPSACPPPF